MTPRAAALYSAAVCYLDRAKITEVRYEEFWDRSRNLFWRCSVALAARR